MNIHNIQQRVEEKTNKPMKKKEYKLWNNANAKHGNNKKYTNFHLNYLQDELQEETNNNANAKRSLDEISKEVNDMKMRLTSNNDMDGDTDSNNTGTNPRALIGEIEKIKKIAEILETIVLPTIVNSQANEQKLNQNNRGTAANSGGESIKILPKGFNKLLQHHNGEDGQAFRFAQQLDNK